MPCSRYSPHANRYALLAIAATALAVEIPFLHYGYPSGHDVDFHLYSWLEVLGQWKLGIFYPRWASLAHFGYGEPRFAFYPPASWTLGGAHGGVRVDACIGQPLVESLGRSLCRVPLCRESVSHSHRLLAERVCGVAGQLAGSAAAAIAFTRRGAIG